MKIAVVGAPGSGNKKLSGLAEECGNFFGESAKDLETQLKGARFVIYIKQAWVKCLGGLLKELFVDRNFKKFFRHIRYLSGFAKKWENKILFHSYIDLEKDFKCFETVKAAIEWFESLELEAAEI